MSVLLPKNIDVKKIKYAEMKVLKSGAKSVYVSYEGSKLLLQTPVMSLPYGVNDNSKFKEDNGDEKKYDLTLSFRGMEENPKMKVFHDKMKALEDKIVEDAFANRQPWFKNNFNNNKDVILTKFTPMVKLDKDKETGEITNKYPPTFKVKLPYDAKNDKFEFDAYDMDTNEIDFTKIVNNMKGGKAQLIIQLNGIWFSGGMFGCSWKVVSGKFQQSNMSKVVFLEDSDAEKADDDEEDDDDISVDEDVIKKPQAQAPDDSNEVEEEEEDVDNDEEVAAEDEEEEERPPTPPPAKPVVKKAVKKTTK